MIDELNIINKLQYFTLDNWMVTLDRCVSPSNSRKVKIT